MTERSEGGSRRLRYGWIVAPAVLALVLGGCGGGGGDASAEQAKLELARHSGAEAAHRGDEIRQLQREVKTLKSRPPAGRAQRIESGPTHEPTTDSRIPASGTYVGEALQRGTPARVDKDYPVQMTFSSTGSYVAYPTLGCEGRLQPTGFDGDDRVYEEQITAGHCDDGGTWLVHVEGPTTLEAAWFLSSASYAVTAVVDR